MAKYILYTDASHLDDTTGIGGVLFKDNEIIDFFSAKVTDDSQYFEAIGILYGLELAKKHNVQNLNVITDSLNNVEFFNKKNNEKHNYFKKEVYQKILDFSEKFENIEYQHTVRERNKIADFLSTLYRKNKATTYIHVEHDFFKNLHVLKVNKIYNESKIISPITLTEVFTHDETHLLNFLHIDLKNGNYFTNSKKIEIDYDIIAKEIYKELETLNTKKYSKLIINGKIAENIHYAIRGYQTMGKNLNACFLDLSNTWQDLYGLNLLERPGKTKLKQILKNLQINDHEQNENNEVQVEKIESNIDNKKINIDKLEETKLPNNHNTINIKTLNNRTRKKYDKYNIEKHYRFNIFKREKNKIYVNVTTLDVQTKEKIEEIHKINNSFVSFINLFDSILPSENSKISFHSEHVFNEALSQLIKNIKDKKLVKNYCVNFVKNLAKYEVVLYSHNKDAVNKSNEKLKEINVDKFKDITEGIQLKVEKLEDIEEKSIKNSSRTLKLSL